MRFRLRTPLQFRLATLMLCITLACVICGLAVSYPAQTIFCVMIALPFVPTAALWCVLVGCSRRRVTIAAMSAVGACVSLAIFQSYSFITAKPAIIRIPGQPQLCFDLNELGLVAVGTALGTILFGGTLIIEDFFRAHAAARSE